MCHSGLLNILFKGILPSFFLFLLNVDSCILQMTQLRKLYINWPFFVISPRSRSTSLLHTLHFFKNNYANCFGSTTLLICCSCYLAHTIYRIFSHTFYNVYIEYVVIRMINSNQNLIDLLNP